MPPSARLADAVEAPHVIQPQLGAARQGPANDVGRERVVPRVVEEDVAAVRGVERRELGVRVLRPPQQAPSHEEGRRLAKVRRGDEALVLVVQPTERLMQGDVLAEDDEDLPEFAPIHVVGADRHAAAAGARLRRLECALDQRVRRGKVKRPQPRANGLVDLDQGEAAAAGVVVACKRRFTRARIEGLQADGQRARHRVPVDRSLALKPSCSPVIHHGPRCVEAFWRSIMRHRCARIEVTTIRRRRRARLGPFGGLHVAHKCNGLRAVVVTDAPVPRLGARGLARAPWRQRVGEVGVAPRPRCTLPRGVLPRRALVFGMNERIDPTGQEHRLNWRRRTQPTVAHTDDTRETVFILRKFLVPMLHASLSCPSQYHDDGGALNAARRYGCIATTSRPVALCVSALYRSTTTTCSLPVSLSAAPGLSGASSSSVRSRGRLAAALGPRSCRRARTAAADVRRVLARSSLQDYNHADVAPQSPH